jgi:UDP-N-acetyl-D-mannosaminuronate dehydrogenase
MGAEVVSYDPYILGMSDVKKLDDLLDKVDAVILGTYHDIFGDLTEEILKRKNIKVVVDGVNKLDKERLVKGKVIYRGIVR